MVKKKGHALAIMSSPACLRKLKTPKTKSVFLPLLSFSDRDTTYRRRNINRIKFRTPPLLIAMRDGICNHQLTQPAPVYFCTSIAAEDAVRDDRHHFFRAVRHEYVGRFHKCAAGVCHIVDQDRDAAVDITNKRHARDLVRLGPLLVDQGEVEVEAVGKSGGTLGAAGVWGDDDGVFVVEVLADVAERCGFRVEAVVR